MLISLTEYVGWKFFVFSFRRRGERKLHRKILQHKQFDVQKGDEFGFHTLHLDDTKFCISCQSLTNFQLNVRGMSIPCQTQTRKYLYNLQMLQPLRFLAPLIFALIPASVFAADVKVSLMTGPTGVRYHFFDKGDLAFGWETKRPSKTDSKIKFCIPAAFTTTTDTIVGIYSYKGNVYNAKAISKTIGGAILIEGGKFEIFPIEKGAKFTPEFIASLRERRASLFQQYQLVQNKTAASFKDKKKFQMRAIVKFSDGREGVVESFKAIDFKTFNEDLVALGVQDALYTDMGAWDEGWFRLPSQEKVVPIGNDRSKTNKQTNWVIYYQNQRK